jgi:hypothetical protein
MIETLRAKAQMNNRSEPQPLLDMPVRTMWSEVAAVRERVAALLADVSESTRTAAVMTASELVENAVKYGEPVPGNESASVVLAIDGDVLRIVVRNGVAAAETVEDLIHHVERVTASQDRAALYLDRLRELMMSGGGASKLGIYRIACEGGFDLACTFSERVVTVTASRRIV